MLNTQGEPRDGSLSERTIRKAIDSDAHGAAHLMLNIAKILCLRLLQTR